MGIRGRAKRFLRKNKLSSRRFAPPAVYSLAPLALSPGSGILYILHVLSELQLATMSGTLGENITDVTERL